MQKISDMYRFANTQNQALILDDLKRLMHYRVMYEYYFKLRYRWLRGGRNIDIEYLMLQMHSYGAKYQDLYKSICNYFAANTFEIVETYFDNVFVRYENNNGLRQKIRGWKRYRNILTKRPC